MDDAFNTSSTNFVMDNETTIFPTTLNDTMMTLPPTMSPTTDFYTEDDMDLILSKGVWMVMFIVALVLFICCPFCITERRRDLCWRRIKERRWISDDIEDDWYAAAMRRRQEERRQRLEEEQRQFKTSRTQEDEIREQFLLQCMAPFTMVREAAEQNENSCFEIVFSGCLTT